MFNAVSVASVQNAEIQTLFDDNLQRLNSAQKVLTELLEASETSFEKFADLRAAAKYAMDTISALRVCLWLVIMIVVYC